jgi:undecaprenyl-diphosphatase
VLGARVAYRAPGALDGWGAGLRGHGIGLAIVFTALGRWWTILPFSGLALVLTLALRSPLLPVLVLVMIQPFTQVANARLKLFFRRPRPGAELVIPERDLSYPSGHAVTAVVYYLGFALLVCGPALAHPAVAATAALLAACAIGIPWSRLALGAHYATDVLGGLCFGVAWLCGAQVAIALAAAMPS